VGKRGFKSFAPNAMILKLKRIEKMLGMTKTVTEILSKLDKVVDELGVVMEENDQNILINNVKIGNLTVENEELIDDNARAVRVQKNIYKLTH
tara:strand:+ start:427 stop:705 length:279 start_codon:yes stop_codon:yes gene_type:complete